MNTAVTEAAAVAAPWRPTNADLAGLLREMRQCRARLKEIRGDLIRVAVEHHGMDQAEALKTDIETYMDGYLVGQGMAQAHRGMKP